MHHNQRTTLARYSQRKTHSTQRPSTTKNKQNFLKYGQYWGLKQTFLQKCTNGQKAHEKCSISLALREMQIKTLRYNFTPIRMFLIQKPKEKTAITQKITSTDGECDVIRISGHCPWECEIVQLVYKMVWQSLKWFNVKLPYDPTISCQGLDPKALKIETSTEYQYSQQHYS